MTYNIYINGDISRWGCSAGWLRQQLRAYANKPCTMYIRSMGGDVNEALDMYRQLKEHGNVTVYIYGFTASAATIIAMGAKKVVMSKNAVMLIHRCLGQFSFWNYLNSEQLERKIKELANQRNFQDTVDQIAASIYAERGKKDIKFYSGWMKSEKWHTAKECKEAGLVDEILEDNEKIVVDEATQSLMMAYGLPVDNLSAKTDDAPEEEHEPEEETPDSTEETEENDEETEENNAETQTTEAHTGNALVMALRSFLSSLGFPVSQEKESHAEIKPSADAPQDTNQITNQSNSTVMAENQNVATLGTAIGAEIKAAADGSVTLSAEQLAKLNEKLSTGEQAAQQVQDIAKKDGAKPAHVEENHEPEGEVMLGAMANKMFKRYKDVLK